MSKTRKQKVVIYCVHNGMLLVHRHVDYPYEQVGVQVPAGTVEPGEDLQAAALRELCEETARDCYEIVRYLGTADYDITPLRSEVQERHFFEARVTGDLPERWPSVETHEGLSIPTRFECFWIPLAHAHVLSIGQGLMLARLIDD